MVMKKKAPDSLATVSGILDKGGIVVLQCDTIYGFLGAVPDTRERLCRIKRRDIEKPLLALIPRLSWLNRFTDQQLPSSLRPYWPGPLTLVFRALEGGTIGLRMPDDPWLVSLLEKTGMPLYSTSVNREGESPMNTIADIMAEFEKEVDLIVDSGDLPGGEASTVLDISKQPFRLLRQGVLRLPKEALEEGKE